METKSQISKLLSNSEVLADIRRTFIRKQNKRRRQVTCWSI